MKLTAFLLLVACLQVAARSNGQTVTLDLKKAPIEKVFNEVSRQTGVSFLYSQSLFQGLLPVTIRVKDATIAEVLNKCFKDQPFNYSVEGGTIVITKKTPSLPERAGDEAIQAQITYTLISGKVTDEDGKPLSSASVKVKGTQQGTTTNAEGVFRLNVSAGDVLVISYVGFESTEYKITPAVVASSDQQSTPGTGVSFTISLTKKVNDMQEVVVNKGYYNTTNRLNTGNVAIIKGEDIVKQPVTDPMLALQGRVAGLYIQQSSGLPGANATIRIRGQNSIFNGNNPLYIVDGIPFGAATLSSGNIPTDASGPSGLSPFNVLNPSDIENVVVLKDADATAIYGSRGANGVILITTRKGRPGNAKFSLNAYTGSETVSHRVKLLTTPQYLEIRHERFTNDGRSPNPNVDYDLTYWDTTRYTDWQKVLIGNAAPFSNIQASLSGGNATTQFVIGGGYGSQSTVFPGSYRDQTVSGHMSITHSSIDNRFYLEGSIIYGVDINLLPVTDLSSAALTLPPDAPPLYDVNGDLNWAIRNGTATFSNPLRYTKTKSKSTTDNMLTQLRLKYRILKGFFVESNFGFNRDHMDQSMLTFSTSVAPPTNLNPDYRLNNFATTDVKNWIIEPQANYEKNLGKGKVNLLLGSTIQENTTHSTGILTHGYYSDALVSSPFVASYQKIEGNFTSLYHYIAFFGRASYNWDEKYILNLTGRRDGSSRFGPGKRFGNFGAAGIGWIFSKEKFFIRQMPFLSFGKFRASYGITGNDQIGDYQYLSTYTPNSALYQGITGLSPTGLTNPYFAWERVKKLEGGLELSFFKERINLSASYYRNRCDNQLIGYLLPNFTGFGSVQANLPATMQNSGWEFTFRSINIHSRNLYWSISANLTLPQNKLVSYPGIETSPYNYTYSPGHSIFSRFVYHFTGVDQQTGLYTFATKSGTGLPAYGTDFVLSKPITQSFFGGIDNTIRFKGFELDAFVQFVKQRGYNMSLYLQRLGANYNFPIEYLNRWQKAGDVTNIQMSSLGVSTIYPYLDFQNSDAVIGNTSFLRIKNLALSYAVPRECLGKLSLRQIKIFAQCQNLVTITSYRGLDPETPGLGMPPLRIITCGIFVGL